MQRISDTLDVRPVLGHGGHPDVLETAGAADADILIAVTASDEVNMVTCQVAKTLFNPRKTVGAGARPAISDTALATAF